MDLAQALLPAAVVVVVCVLFALGIMSVKALR